MKFSRRTFFLPAAAAVASCTRAPGPLRKIGVSVGPFHTMSPLYLAHERGYFREAGFDVQLRPTRNAAEALPLVAKGDLDAGFFSLTPASINIMDRGAKVRIAAAREFLSTCAETGMIYQRRDRFPAGGATAEAWRGKRVALATRTSTTDFVLDAWRKHLGLEHDQLERRYLDRAAGLAALFSGGVDAMLNSFSLPINAGEKQSLLEKNDASIRALDGLQYSFIFFSGSFVDAPAELGAAFLAAWFRGCREYLGGATPQFLHRWIEENHMDAPTVLNACRRSLVEDGAVRLADVRRQVEWYVERGYTETMPAKLETMYDPRWVELARRKPA